jgi:hypothetical protein
MEYQGQLDREGKILYVSIAEEYYTNKGKLEGKLEGQIHLALNQPFLKSSPFKPLVINQDFFKSDISYGLGGNE